MARQSKIKAEDALAAELAANDRKEKRKTGFDMMPIRDRGYKRLSNGVTILWPTDRELEDGETITRVPDGKFVLIVDGEYIPFDTDEFRQQLRWA